MGNFHRIEQRQHGLAHDEVLRRIVALEPPPGHEQDAGLPINHIQGNQCVQQVPSPEFCMSTAGIFPAI